MPTLVKNVDGKLPVSCWVKPEENKQLVCPQRKTGHWSDEDTRDKDGGILSVGPNTRSKVRL